MHRYLDRTKLDPPVPEIAEVSIFGNGHGEAVLVHLGYNEWAIFDSCLNPKTKRPAPLEYLESIKQDPASTVKLFLISHWHSDHIKGGAATFQACISSVFCCSDLLTHPQMIQLADPDQKGFQRPLAVKEFADLLKELKSRKPASPQYASPNRKILSLSYPRRAFSTEIFSLSPPDAEKTKFLAEIGSHLPGAGKTKKEPPLKLPNAWSVVTWIAIGKWNVLLGADLEQVGDSERGWNAVLMSGERPRGKAGIFKIPHHGSRNAHNSMVWREMVQSPAIALLSPFDPASLPSGDDVARLCSLTRQCHGAAMLEPVQPKRRTNAVERQLNEMAKERKVIGGKFGQVRVRFNPLDQDNHEVALIDQAIPLCGN